MVRKREKKRGRESCGQDIMKSEVVFALARVLGRAAEGI